MLDGMGWIAAALTLLTFSMREMRALRLAGITANLAFILYGVGEALYPVAVLHILLLPCNVLRFWELARATEGAARRGSGEPMSTRPAEGTEAGRRMSPISSSPPLLQRRDDVLYHLQGASRTRGLPDKLGNMVHATVRLFLPLGKLANPGQLYNLGNLVGLVTGLGVAVGVANSGPWASSALDFLVGNPPALAMTVATLIFFWGGMAYSRAWADGSPPLPHLNRRGDLYSGVGAICLAIGLFLLGDPLLAATAGFLHALGKFGSAFLGGRTIMFLQQELSIPLLSKDLVLASRVPALASALMGLDADVLPISFAVCTLIWAIADWRLLDPESLWKKLLRRLLSPRGAP